ncbi:MAG: alpha/beta hydrolase-fold protein [candidate division KSB1 bacterium]|nr:alpha/beta hydrolase-fold protein [candidate division KSB1 bacterium]
MFTNRFYCIVVLTTTLILLGIYADSLAQKRLPRQRKKFEWVSPIVEVPGVHQRIFYSKIVQSRVSYHIYLPPHYEKDANRRFPVLYWLHGSGPRPITSIRFLVNWFDEAIGAGKMPPVLVVFPYGRQTMWCDSKDGSVPIESVFINELIQDVDSTFRTVPTRKSRLIEGFSMGGYGALRLGFKYPDLFGTVSSLSGGPLQPVFSFSLRASDRLRKMVLRRVYGGDMEYFKAQSPWRLVEQNADAIRGQIRIRLVIGDQDAMLQVTRAFEAHLTELNIPHSFTMLPGVGHKPEAVLNALGGANWEFYRQVFQMQSTVSKNDSSTVEH